MLVWKAFDFSIKSEGESGWVEYFWFFLFITLNILSCHSLLAYRVFVEKSADNLMGVPLYVICCFFLVAFNILSLSLIFVSLITMGLSVFLPEFILPGTLCAYWFDWLFPFPCYGSFQHYLFKYFLRQVISLFLLLLGLL